MFWCLPFLHRWDCLLKHPFKCDFPPELQEELGVCVCVCVCVCVFNGIQLWMLCDLCGIFFLSVYSLTFLSVGICTVWGRCEYPCVCEISQLPFILGCYLQAVTCTGLIVDLLYLPPLQCHDKKKEKKNPFKSQFFLKSQLHSMAACNLYVFPHNVLYIIEQHFPTGCPQNPWWNLRGFAKYKW